jgi:hypothetical protein
MEYKNKGRLAAALPYFLIVIRSGESVRLPLPAPPAEQPATSED